MGRRLTTNEVWNTFIIVNRSQVATLTATRNYLLQLRSPCWTTLESIDVELMSELRTANPNHSLVSQLGKTTFRGFFQQRWAARSVTGMKAGQRNHRMIRLLHVRFLSKAPCRRSHGLQRWHVVQEVGGEVFQEVPTKFSVQSRRKRQHRRTHVVQVRSVRSRWHGKPHCKYGCAGLFSNLPHSFIRGNLARSSSTAARLRKRE